MNFGSAFIQKKPFTEDQNQIAETQIKLSDRDDRIFKTYNPAHGEQQQNSHHQCQGYSEIACSLLNFSGKPVGCYGDKNYVINPKDHLKESQRQQTYYSLGRQQGVHTIVDKALLRSEERRVGKEGI